MGWFWFADLSMKRAWCLGYLWKELMKPLEERRKGGSQFDGAVNDRETKKVRITRCSRRRWARRRQRSAFVVMMLVLMRNPPRTSWWDRTWTWWTDWIPGFRPTASKSSNTTVFSPHTRIHALMVCSFTFLSCYLLITSLRYALLTFLT